MRIENLRWSATGVVAQVVARGCRAPGLSRGCLRCIWSPRGCPGEDWTACDMAALARHRLHAMRWMSSAPSTPNRLGLATRQFLVADVGELKTRNCRLASRSPARLRRQLLQVITDIAGGRRLAL